MLGSGAARWDLGPRVGIWDRVLGFGAACWDPHREGQISAIDRVQKRAAKFAYHTNRPNWETLA